MSLAMDMQMYVERNKAGWWAEGEAEGRAEGRVEGRSDILMNMLISGQTPEQISQLIKVPLEEILRKHYTSPLHRPSIFLRSSRGNQEDFFMDRFKMSEKAELLRRWKKASQATPWNSYQETFPV